MHGWLGLTSIAIAALAAASYATWVSHDNGAEAAGPTRRLIVPAVASDSLPTSAGTLEVVVIVELLIHEPALTAGGATEVEVRAIGHGPLPLQGGPSVTVPVSFEITTHPGDVCAWNPDLDRSATLTYFQPPGAGMEFQLNFFGGVWHYEVICPGELKPTRFPAGDVNESLTGSLVLLGIGQPQGTVVSAPAGRGLSDPACVKRKGVRQGSNILGEGVAAVFVNEVPCAIEVAQHIRPTQNTAYEPGGLSPRN
jgi:hypothetical protein